MKKKLRDYVSSKGKMTGFECPVKKVPVSIDNYCNACDFECYIYESFSDGHTHAVLICGLAHDENKLVSGKPTRFP